MGDMILHFTDKDTKLGELKWPSDGIQLINN